MRETKRKREETRRRQRGEEGKEEVGAKKEMALF